MKNMKTELNYSKGEWKILWHNYTHFATINTDSLHRICAIEVNNGKDIDEATANAKLIAAAPDMLSACQSVLNNFEVNKKYGQILTEIELTAGINLLTRAINKATL